MATLRPIESLIRSSATILASNNAAMLQNCLFGPIINHQPVRHKTWRNVRPILGWPRKTLYLMSRKYPEPHLYNWRPFLPADEQYTVNPLPIQKLGGRDLESGRVVVRTLGGGNLKRFRWVDMYRNGNEDGSVKEERVLKIRYDPLHTPNIALVADAERMRWIFATHGIKEDDIIRTHSELPRNPVRPNNGDAHPIGALPSGTKVHNFEVRPGEGAKFCITAGSCAEIIKRTLEYVTVRLPHGDMFKVDSSCMAVVGQMSNIGHGDIHLWCPQRKRWLGKRPRSGQWHRKDGYCGRKLRRPKTIDVTTESLTNIQNQVREKEIYDLST